MHNTGINAIEESVKGNKGIHGRGQSELETINIHEKILITGNEIRKARLKLKTYIEYEHSQRCNKVARYRRKTDLKYNLNNKMATAMGRSLKGSKKNRHWEDLVNYVLIDLIKRLKKVMPKGYHWEDYLEGKLHIDHIIPISVFNFTKPEHIDFKRCWALSNLQLLPAKENMIKNAKLYKSFQPALKM